MPIGSVQLRRARRLGEAMAARSGGVLAHSASVLGVLVTFAGCADDGVSLHVLCPIQPDIKDNVCIYDPAGDSCVLEGVMNLAATNFYRQSLRVESGLKPRTREVPPQGEPNGIQLHSAEVELRTPAGERIVFNDIVGDDGATSRVPNPFEVVASGYVQAGGVGVITLPLIMPAQAQQLRRSPTVTEPKLPQIVISIKVKGKTNGDQEVTGGEYLWPVRLVSVDVTRGANMGCVVMGYCVSSLGQDNYAAACR